MNYYLLFFVHLSSQLSLLFPLAVVDWLSMLPANVILREIEANVTYLSRMFHGVICLAYVPHKL